MALDYKNSLNRYRRYLQTVQARPLWSASLWTVFSLALMIILLVFAFRPTLVTISTFVGKIQSYKEIDAKLDQKIMAVQRASEELQKNENRLSLIEEALPETAQWEGWSKTILGKASESGVTIDLLTVEKIPLPGNVPPPVKKDLLLPENSQRLVFTLKGTAQYDQIRLLITKLESLRRVTMVANLTIGKTKEGGLYFELEGQSAFGWKEINI